MLGIIIALAVVGVIALFFTNKQLEPLRNRVLAPRTKPAPADTTTVVTAKSVTVEKKKEAKKVEVTFSWWLLLYSFLIVGFIIPSLMTDSLSTRDTWLLVILLSVAAAFLAATIMKYYFDFDGAIGKVNKIAVGLLILGFVFLLFQNNFSTTATLKDAGARTSTFTTGVVEFLAGKRQYTSKSTSAPATQFVGEAHGETFTLRSDVWSIFAYPDHHCTRFSGGVGIEKVTDRVANTLALKAPAGSPPQEVQVNVFPVGTTWKGYTCEYN